MRIPIVVIICLICHACSPKITNSSSSNNGKSSKFNSLIKQPYDDWYDSFLEEGEIKKHSDYISIVSQKSDGNYIKRSFFPDTRTMIKYNEYMDTGLYEKHGPEKIWTDKGVLISQGQYSDGNELGPFQNFNRKTGNLTNEGNYRLGEKEGTWKYYYPDGQLESQTQFKKGLREGLCENYTEDGEAISKIEYRADTIYNSKILKIVDSKLPLLPLNKSEQMPMYGDGCPELETLLEQKACSERKMLTTVYKNLKYPPMAREYGLEGMAIVQFVIDEAGKLTELDVVRGLNQEITDEVTRVVKLLDNWVPGMQDGEPVRVMYTLPVRFKLE